MSNRPVFRAFDDDPFFSDHSNQLMHGMFASPFGALNAVESGHGQQQRGTQNQSMQLFPFGGFGFGNMFGNMDSMMSGLMQNMNKEFAQSSSGGAGGYGYQQASFMSYSNTGQGAPKVFQASTATRTGPGGVRETRKSVRDSELALEKMSVGHHIMDRGHEIEKHRDLRSNNIEEIQNFHNMDESDAQSFDQEWREKTKQAFQGIGNGRDRDRRVERRELPSTRDRHREERRALPEPPSSSLDRHRSGRKAMPESTRPSKEARSEHRGRTAEEGKHRDRS